MENFTPYSSLTGGIIIGISAMVLLLGGRIAGISGIVAGLLPPRSSDAIWRLLFIVGLIVGATLFPIFGGDVSFVDLNPFNLDKTGHLIILVIAGLLVGIGTYIGSGCTSGHGVCGIGRLSVRSIIATTTFMITGAVTVFVMQLIVGG
jgi:uncharacterized membrane protein YedE/YeeE